MLAALLVPAVAEAAPEARLSRPALSVIAAGVIWAPLIEELLFRGWMLHRLRDRLGPGPAIVVSSLQFALAHPQQLAVMPTRFGAGITLAVAVLVTGTLWSSILIHFIVNAVGVAGMLLSGTLSRPPVVMSKWPLAAILVISLVTAAGLVSWIALMVTGWRRRPSAAAYPQETPVPPMPQ